MTKVLIVSDIHYEHGEHHKIYQGYALDWLRGIIKKQNINEVVAVGDLGHAWTVEEWEDLATLARLNIIYGNHDNLFTLTRARNRDNTSIWCHDAERREIAGLTWGFVNGIVSEKSLIKDQTPRQFPWVYESFLQKLTNVDVVCTHESPLTKEYLSFVHEPMTGLRIMESALNKLQPKLAFSGHISGPYTIARFGRTLSIRVDSSQKEQHYAIYTSGTFPKVEIWHNDELVNVFDVP